MIQVLYNFDDMPCREFYDLITVNDGISARGAYL